MTQMGKCIWIWCKSALIGCFQKEIPSPTDTDQRPIEIIYNTATVHRERGANANVHRIQGSPSVPSVSGFCLFLWLRWKCWVKSPRSNHYHYRRDGVEALQSSPWMMRCNTIAANDDGWYGRMFPDLNWMLAGIIMTFFVASRKPNEFLRGFFFLVAKRREDAFVSCNLGLSWWFAFNILLLNGCFVNYKYCILREFQMKIHTLLYSLDTYYYKCYRFGNLHKFVIKLTQIEIYNIE